MTNSDDLILIAGGRKIFGWNSIRVTRGLERCPSDFELSMTERYPGELDFILRPGDRCNLYIGDPNTADQIPVVTGYIDRVVMALSAERHTITVTGRGKCQDLVDCAAMWKGGQFSNATALDVAEKLAEPYGIGVSLINVDGQLPRAPQLTINWGETVFARIEEIARWSQLLVYEGTDGNLILSRVGKEKTGDSFAQGVNIEDASVFFSMDQRYSKYVVRMLGTDTLIDTGTGGDVLMTVYDDNVPRPRVKYIITENGDAGGAVAEKRGLWEMKRRWGRGNQVHITTDTWRGKNGAAWEPNTLVEISLPALKIPSSFIPSWLVTEVTYSRDEHGTHAALVLMPPEAFSVEPNLPPWEKGFSDVKR